MNMRRLSVVVFLLSVLWCMAGLTAAPAGGGGKAALTFHNVTDAAVDVWVNDQYRGAVAARSAAMLAEPVGGAADGPVAVTGISEVADGYRINGLWVARKAGQAVDLVWGGVTVPTDLASKEADVASPDRHAELFALRWRTLNAGAPGKPFKASDTLISRRWNDRRVWGQMLTMHAGEASTLVNSVGMLMVWIPKGTFNIAQAGGPAGRAVTLTDGFYMAVTETTRAQWALVMEEKPDLNKVVERQMPAVEVTWAQADSFGPKITDAPGWSYRLPTEVQWEYACRGGKSVPFSPAGVDVDKIMWHSRNSGGTAHPVGQLLPNDYGLYDMHGNVREWCSSWWSFTPSVGVDPVGPASGTERVRRGGAYNMPERYGTSGRRDSHPPDVPAPWLGFRATLQRR